MLNLYVPPSRALKIDSRADSTIQIMHLSMVSATPPHPGHMGDLTANWIIAGLLLPARGI